MTVTPTLFTSCNALPPEGAVAPAAWQSQFRGPCWLGADASTLPASFFDPLFAATSRAFSWTVS